MKYFYKQGCDKCTWVKKNCDLNGIDMYELTRDDPDALGMLAFVEGVQLAETSLPILVLDDEYTKIVGAVKIKQYLEGI